MQLKEQTIQKMIIDYLRLKGYFVYKNSSVGIYVKKTGHYIPAQTRGVADLTAIKDKQVYQIEVKKKGGVQSEYQKEFQKNWEDKGGIYLIGGLKDIIDKL